MLSLFSLLWPAAAVACSLAPRADDITLLRRNGTDNTTDNTPWVPSCKLPATWADLSVGFNSPRDCVAGNGTIRAFMMFVDFSDAEANNDTAQDLHDFFLPDAADWFKNASYGKLSLDVTADVSKIYRMPSSAQSYIWDDSFTWARHNLYIQDAIMAYTNNGTLAAPADYDILYIIPTRNVSSWMVRSYQYGSYVVYDEKLVARKAITFGTDPYQWWGYKAFNHETGHAMCLPDYYPLDGGPTGEWVGGWSAMGNIGGIAPDFFAWDKWRLGWIADDNVDCVLEAGTTEHTLTPLEVEGGTKAVVIGRNKTTALVAEARIPEGLDPRVCSPGVLLYTVDTTVSTGSGPIRVIDAKPNSGGCGVDNYDELNDGTLSLDPGSVSSYEVPGWGVKVTVVNQDNQQYKIQVEYQGSSNSTTAVAQ